MFLMFAPEFAQQGEIQNVRRRYNLYKIINYYNITDIFFNIVYNIIYLYRLQLCESSCFLVEQGRVGADFRKTWCDEREVLMNRKGRVGAEFGKTGTNGRLLYITQLPKLSFVRF